MAECHLPFLLGHHLSNLFHDMTVQEQHTDRR